MEIRGLVPGS